LRGDLGDQVTRDISKQELRFVHPPLSLTGKLLKELLGGLICDIGQSSHGLLRIRTIFRHEVDVKRWPVSNKNFPIPIKDQSTRRWHIHHSKAIVLGSIPKHMAVNNLKMPQPQSQHEETARADP
jgi:hypothetical protein